MCGISLFNSNGATLTPRISFTSLNSNDVESGLLSGSITSFGLNNVLPLDDIGTLGKTYSNECPSLISSITILSSFTMNDAKSLGLNHRFCPLQKM